MLEKTKKPFRPISVSKVAQDRTSVINPAPKHLCARLYPNGEVVVYAPKKMKVEGAYPKLAPRDHTWMKLLLSCFEIDKSQAEKWLGALGLSHLKNFDRKLSEHIEGDSRDGKLPVRYGAKGITPYGARHVRCAAHLLQNEAGKGRLVFATCTVPSLPIETMRTVHERWHKVVDAYRRKVTRALKDNHLTGEIITVSEVQEKRYERTGVPVLHIHSVFVGRRRDGKWALTRELHDEIWRSSLDIAVSGIVAEFRYACNLQRVRESAEGYLGKYMTKGSKVVRQMAADGFDGWLPKQWWSCSRSLTKRVHQQTRHVDDIAEWLDNVAEIEGAGVWMYYRDVHIDMGNGYKFRMARVGRLSHRAMADIQAAYDDNYLRDMAY